MGCPKCRHEIEQKIREQENARIRKLRADVLESSGIPIRYIGKGFDDYRPVNANSRMALDISRRYAANFRALRKTGACLTFCGKPGTGKTHLACAIGQYVLKEFGCDIHYATAFQAIQKTKESYSKKTAKNEREVLESYQLPALLILDEVGLQFDNDRDMLILHQIISRRYDDVRPTIMISNFPEEMLEEHIGIRAMDRFREGGGVVVAFDWESYRK